MKSNRLMKALLASGGTPSISDFLETEKRIERFFKELKFENGCLFLAEHNGKADAANVTDKVEFEAWHNEIFINAEFPKRKITTAFAMQFFAQFNARLQTFRSSSEELGCEICAIMSEDNGQWTYRFHIVRKRANEASTLEPLWISEDLEKFSQPIMYELI